MSTTQIELTGDEISYYIEGKRAAVLGENSDLTRINIPITERIISGPLTILSNPRALQGIGNKQVSVPIFFDKCTFKSTVKIEDYSQLEKLKFIDCIFEEEVTIAVVNKSINFHGSHFKKGIILHIRESRENIKISNLKIDDWLTISGSCKQSTLIVSDINKENPDQLQGNVRLKNLTVYKFLLEKICVHSIKIAGNIAFEYEANLRELVAGFIKIHNVTIGLLIEFVSSRIKNLTIDNLVRDGANRHIYLKDNCIIDEMSFPLNMLSKTVIAESTINKLEIRGTNEKNSILDLRNVTMSNFLFEEVFNEGQIALRNLRFSKGGCLSIKSSNLGKTDFIHCDLSNAVLEFENSKITEIFVSQSDFPNIVHSDGSPSFGQAQLAFGQLNTAFQKQGDSVRAVEYQAREVEAHFQILKQQSYLFSRFFNKIRMPFRIRLLPEKTKSPIKAVAIEFYTLAIIFSLWLNDISNKFGRSWQRGVLFSFCVGALFFYLLIISTENYKFGFSLHYDPEVLQSYIKFMNPLRFFDLEYLFKSKINSNTTYITIDSFWCYFWDFLGRIFVAYGYYQTIQAFRRYGKK